MTLLYIVLQRSSLGCYYTQSTGEHHACQVLPVKHIQERIEITGRLSGIRVSVEYAPIRENLRLTVTPRWGGGSIPSKSAGMTGTMPGVAVKAATCDRVS
jgi:hypothetical protein